MTSRVGSPSRRRLSARAGSAFRRSRSRGPARSAERLAKVYVVRPEAVLRPATERAECPSSSAPCWPAPPRRRQNRPLPDALAILWPALHRGTSGCGRGQIFGLPRLECLVLLRTHSHLIRDEGIDLRECYPLQISPSSSPMSLSFPVSTFAWGALAPPPIRSSCRSRPSAGSPPLGSPLECAQTVGREGINRGAGVAQMCQRGERRLADLGRDLRRSAS